MSDPSIHRYVVGQSSLRSYIDKADNEHSRYLANWSFAFSYSDKRVSIIIYIPQAPPVWISLYVRIEVR